MKNRIMLFVIIALMINVSVYAEDKIDGVVEKAQDSVFQKTSDVINGKYEVKTVPFKKITIFQSMADKISEVNQK